MPISEQPSYKPAISGAGGLDRTGTGLLGPRDFWTIALGSGLWWTINQMGAELAQEVKHEVLDRLATNGVNRIETNVIYAVAEKQSDQA